MTLSTFGLIVAATEEWGIGVKHNLPWRIPKDMAFFKHATTTIPKELENQPVQNAVIMGRVTWESIPPKFRPLDGRFNIVVSRNPNYDLGLEDPAKSNTVLVDSLENAFKAIDPKKHARTFIIGGAQIYALAIKETNCTHILLTRIKNKIECDAFFPEIKDSEFRLASHQELEDYVQQHVPEGIQKHKELEYEFTLYLRR